jgi:hypothetical protein
VRSSHFSTRSNSDGWSRRTPSRFSIARNCRLWNPDAGSSMSRKSRKSSGVMVSSTRSWSTSSFWISVIRLSLETATPILRSSTESWRKSSITESSSCRICLNHSS